MCHHREYKRLEVIFIQTGPFPFCKTGSVCSVWWKLVLCVLQLFEKAQTSSFGMNSILTESCKAPSKLPSCSALPESAVPELLTGRHEAARDPNSSAPSLHKPTPVSWAHPLPRSWSPAQGLGAQRSRSHSAAHLGGGGLVLGRALHLHASTGLTYSCNVYWVLCLHPPRSFGTKQCGYMVTCFRSALSTEILSLTPIWPKAELGSRTPITPQDAHSLPLYQWKRNAAIQSLNETTKLSMAPPTPHCPSVLSPHSGQPWGTRWLAASSWLQLPLPSLLTQSYHHSLLETAEVSQAVTLPPLTLLQPKFCNYSQGDTSETDI